MTQPDLARLEGLVGAAYQSPLPWRAARRMPVSRTDPDQIECDGGHVASFELDTDCLLAIAAVNALPALLARVRELEGRNAALAEALEPFARDYEDAGVDHLPDDARFGEVDCDQGQLTVGHLRRARAALTLNRSETDAG